MAIRVPFKLTSSNELQQMTEVEIDKIRELALVEYLASPSLTLTVQANGNLAAMTERAYEAGASSVSNVAFPASPASTVAVNTTWDNIEENRPTTPNTWADDFGDDVNIDYPLYYNTAGELQAMTKEDFFDTFIDEAIASWYSPSGSGNFASAGTYAVYDGDLVGFTRVSNTPVYSNDVANVSAFASGNLPEATNQMTTTTNYYLYQKNYTAVTGFELPMKINDNEEIAQMSEADLKAILRYHFKYAVMSRTNSTLNYEIQAASGTLTGIQMGTGMVDTVYSSQTRRTQQTGDNYYAQFVPSGTALTRETYYLRLIKS